MQPVAPTVVPERNQMLNEKLARLHALYADTTPGNWGPTTSPPEGPEGGPHFVKGGERGKPTWGAVVSDEDPREGVDHNRYTVDNEWYWEPGTDMYGGTLVCESLMQGNGEFIAEVKNMTPGLIRTIEGLANMLLMTGVRQELVVETIEELLNEK